MTEQLYSNNIKKILKEKREIEKNLKVKLTSNGKIIILEGKPEDELIALKFVEAVNLGFSIPAALDLRYEDFQFSIIRIKNISKRKNLSQVRGRIIGMNRKVLDTLEDLTNCSIVLHDNLIGIIGVEDDVKKAEFALKHLVAGSKHSVVYGWLEKKNVEEKESF